MNAVLNVAVGERYMRGQQRLSDSLNIIGDTTDRRFWRGEWPEKPHADAPYGFKIDAFRAAAAVGYEKALWLDAVCVALRPLDLIWAYLDRVPALVLADGWNIGQWTSDAALNLFGVDRDRAMGMQLCLAGVLALNLNHLKARKFLRRWGELRDQGAFVGPWTNHNSEASTDPRCKGHRHDQSAASWLCYEIGIPMARLPTFVRYESADAPDAVIWATGI